MTNQLGGSTALGARTLDRPTATRSVDEQPLRPARESSLPEVPVMGSAKQAPAEELRLVGGASNGGRAATDEVALLSRRSEPEFRYREISVVPQGTPVPRGIAAYLAGSPPVPAPVALIDAAV